MSEEGQDESNGTWRALAKLSPVGCCFIVLQCTYVSVSVLSHPGRGSLESLQKDSFQLLLFIKFSLSFFEKPRINRLSQIKVDPWYLQGLGTKTVNT